MQIETYNKVVSDLKRPFTDSPVIVFFPGNITVFESEKHNVTLFCNATGRPTASLSWIRVSDETTVASGNTLLIQTADRTDRGEYRCEANNGVGNAASKTAYLDVQCKCISPFLNVKCL